MWKTRKPDVVTFQLRLMDNILELQEDLVIDIRPRWYKRFNISDPKPRVIHKATVEIVSSSPSISRVVSIFRSAVYF